MQAIVENPPVLLRDGNVIAEGFDSELDELRKIRDHAGQFLIDLRSQGTPRKRYPNAKNWLQPCQWLLH